MASNDFINECKNRANGNRLGRIIIEDVNTPITNSDKLQSLSVDSGCYVDGNIIGAVYVKCLKADFLDSLDINTTDKTIQAQIGVKYGDSTTEYIEMGNYTTDKQKTEITAKSSQITAYDKLYEKLEEKYVCNIDYSNNDITLADLYVDVCYNLGLTPTTTVILNGNIPISDNPFKNGEKNRTVLKTVATVACSFVSLDNENDTIELKWLSTNNEPDYTFELNDYSNVEGNDIVFGPINTVIIKNSQIDDENVTETDNESIEEYGEHSIVINEDYILHNSELRQQAMTPIFNRLNGLKYTNCKLTTSYGKPFLEMGAKIRVVTGENEYFDTYNLKHNFEYDGSFTSIIESPVLTTQEIKTKQNVSLGQLLYNTQIEIDKQKGVINSIVSKTSEFDPVLEYFNSGGIGEQLTDAQEEILNEAVATVQSTMLTQTSEIFEMLFSSTGIQDAVDNVQESLASNNAKLIRLDEYVRFEGAKITLGKSSSQTKLVIENDRISFMNGTTESAYISENTLYITDSTILKKLNIGHWEEKEDEYGNLNTKWVGGVS